jgi:A/G-specific adenine glycosylase
MTTLASFRELVWDYYRDHARPMPWRDQPTPYNVVISEVMLQQTQVARALQKYPSFMAAFPDFAALATAPTVAVLAAWQGMGYNRRALNLQRIAQTIVQEYVGQLPRDPAELVKLPGIGPGTAGAIAAFAFNEPVTFIETNIRRVFLHHFFADHTDVPDSDLLPLITKTLDRAQPRQWYYALMDYGTHLAITIPNPNRRSQHYTRQSRFEGSDRQIRGAIIRLLLEFPVLTTQDVANRFPAEPPDRIMRIMDQLTKEGFLSQQ